MPAAAFLGVDVTTGELALAVRSEDGQEDYAALRMQGATCWNGDENYPGFDLAPLPRMLLELVAQLAAKSWDFSRPGALSVSCRQHDLVLLDADGKLLLPAISWQCNAAVKEAQAINGNDAVTKIIRRVEPRLVLPKLQNILAQEPALRGKLQRVMTTGDWIAWQLTGQESLNTSEAQSNGLFDPARRELATIAIQAAGLDPRWFPRLVESGAPVGKIDVGNNRGGTDWGAVREKLPGWEFLAGMGDNHASAVGCGVTDGRSLLISAGTSGTINWVSQRFPQPESSVLCFGFFAQNLWLLMLPRCGAWYNDGLAEFAHPHEDDHALLNRLADQADLRTLTRIEYQSGECYRPGWTRQTLKAVVGSLQFSIMAELLVRVKQLLGEAQDTHIQRVILTGGLSQSEFFRHVFQVGVKVLQPELEVLISGRRDPLRYKTTAYGALVNAEFRGRVADIPQARFPTVPCPGPDDGARAALLESRLRQTLRPAPVPG